MSAEIRVLGAGCHFVLVYICAVACYDCNTIVLGCYFQNYATTPAFDYLHFDNFWHVLFLTSLIQEIVLLDRMRWHLCMPWLQYRTLFFCATLSFFSRHCTALQCLDFQIMQNDVLCQTNVKH